MQTIVLKDNQSEHFDLITYPDGQHNIKLHLDKLDIKKPVAIKCRIKNFYELEVLSCLTSSLHKNDFNLHAIDYIYLFGMRSDRSFSNNEPNYFRDVVAPIVNSFQKVRGSHNLLFFPHSATSASHIDNSRPSPSEHINHPDFRESIRIGGDKSADFSEIYFNKIRTENGIHVELSPENFEKLKNEINLYPGKQILICDDLCDGGATFIAEAIFLRKHFPEMRRLALFVAHGLFTKGVECILEHFDFIYCSNSYQDIDHPKVFQFKVI